MLKTSIKRIRAGITIDPYSGEEQQNDWDNVSEIIVKNCAIAPTKPGELVFVDRNDPQNGWTLYCRGNSVPDIKPNDRVSYMDQLWNVQGYGAVWKSPFTGLIAGTTFELDLME